MILRFDSVGGASGDMLLGCLADLGADLGRIEAQVRTALPDHFHVRREEIVLQGLRGTRVTVDVHDHDGHHGHDHAALGSALENTLKPAEKPHHHGHAHAMAHRNLPEILALFEAAKLPKRATALASATFRRLAEAEAAVHGVSPDQVHFHEVGAVDAIVDIMGSCLALEQLGVTAVSVGPLPEGEGTFRCAHGVMPIPAPATAELLRGHPVIRVDEPFELVTPTGAALLMTWKALLPAAKAPYTALRNGLGFGQRTLRERPNLLRATLAEPTDRAAPALSHVLLLETHLDDCPGEWLGSAMERLLAAGALDVWFTPVHMKKSRPGTQLSVLCDPAGAEALKAILFACTTTFGIREIPLTRTVLDRRIEPVATPFGEVRLKIGSRNGVVLVAQPEHEDCRRLSEQHGCAVRDVHDAAKAAFVRRGGHPTPSA